MKSFTITKIYLIVFLYSITSFQIYGQGVVNRYKKTSIKSKAKTSRTKQVVVSSPNGYINGHGYVDLGLGVKWATFNLGATNLSGEGNLYAWGETTKKDKYDADTYKFCKDTVRYNTGAKFGGVYIWTDVSFIDIGQDISCTCNDPAYIIWGKEWHTPTRENFLELINRCKWNWHSIDGIKGYVVTGPNGKSIFLPAKYREIYNSWSATYWTASVVDYKNRIRIAWNRAFAFFECKDKYEIIPVFRMEGNVIRPVTNK